MVSLSLSSTLFAICAQTTPMKFHSPKVLTDRKRWILQHWMRSQEVNIHARTITKSMIKTLCCHRVGCRSNEITDAFWCVHFANVSTKFIKWLNINTSRFSYNQLVTHRRPLVALAQPCRTLDAPFVRHMCYFIPCQTIFRFSHIFAVRTSTGCLASSTVWYTFVRKKTSNGKLRN